MNWFSVIYGYVIMSHPFSLLYMELALDLKTFSSWMKNYVEYFPKDRLLIPKSYLSLLISFTQIISTYFEIIQKYQ